MEYVIGLVLALFGGLFYYKKRAHKAETDAILGETRGRDITLKEEQKAVGEAIRDLDQGIKDLKQEHKADNKVLTDKERAKKWDN